MTDDDTFEVYEQTDPLIRYTITEAGGPHNLAAYDSLEWHVRDSTTGDPVAPKRTTTANPGGIVVTNALGGKCEVQARSADLGAPGRKRTYLIGIKGGLRTPLSFKYMVVKDL